MTSQVTSEGNVIVQDKEVRRKQGNTHWRCDVNRQLLPLKMFYFFFYGASGTFIPFITIYLKHLNMSASETGLIAGFPMLIAMIIRAVIGMIADKLSARKTALLICCLGFGTAFFAMWFVPQRKLPREKPLNSTRDHLNNMSLPNQQLLYVWVCLTNSGQEICRYPASGNYFPCTIVEDKNLGRNSGHQSGDVDFTANDSDYTHEHDNAPRDREDININSIKSKKSSDVNNKIIDDRYQAYETFDNITLCFIANSENTNSNTVSHRDLRNENIKQREIDKTKAWHSFQVSVSPTQNLHLHLPNQNPMNDALSCLLKCTKRLGNVSDDETSDVTLNQTISKSKVSKPDPSRGITADMTLLLSFLLLIMGKSLYSASTSLVDAVAYTILGPHSLKWGQQRLWGTIGTGVIALSITFANDSRQVENFTELFITCMGLTFLAFLVGLFKLRADKAPKNETFFKDLVKLLSSGSVRLFLMKLLFYGVIAGTVQNFTFWFLVDIGSTQTTLRVCLIIYCVSSIFALRYSRLVLDKLGHTKTMYISLVAYAIRYAALSFLTNAWFALPVEILHGMTYSLFWAAASSTASIVATSETRATSQGLAGAMYWDLGRGLGIIVSGQFLQVFGARWTFRAYSMACLCVLPLFWMLDRIWPLTTSKVVHRKCSKSQDVEVGVQLLKSDTMNGFFLINNQDKQSINRKIKPAGYDDLEMTNFSERNIPVTKHSSLVEESKSEPRGLGIQASETSNEDIRLGEAISRILGGSMNKMTVNDVSHRDEKCIRESHETETKGNVSKSSDNRVVLSYIY